MTTLLPLPPPPLLLLRPLASLLQLPQFVCQRARALQLQQHRYESEHIISVLVAAAAAAAAVAAVAAAAALVRSKIASDGSFL